MIDFLSAMMGTICCILFIAVVVCIVIISQLLSKVSHDRQDIEKLRRENSELWTELHAPFIRKIKENEIENEM